MKKKIFNQLFFFISLIFLIALSYISRPPIYGKLKFILLNTFWPYYDIAKELDENSLVNTNTFFYSDPVSEYSFFAAFGMQVKIIWRTLDPMYDHTIPIQTLISQSNPPSRHCLINLKGFPDTWVPHLTGHWDPIISNTARFYEHNGYRGKKLAITIENQFKDKCIVLKDKELPWEAGENFRYRAPNLNYSEQQQDVHILQFRKSLFHDKYTILIDAGFITQTREKLLDYLAVNEIYRIDEIFITHPHKDHYSGLYELIQFGIPIGKVWMNIPLKENCDREIPWGCDYQDLLKLQNLMKEKNISYSEIHHTDPKNPKVLYQDEFNKLELLFASPPVNPQAGNVDINDLSMIMKLKTNKTTYLFTGDLNSSLSEYLKSEPAFQADIFKVSHHGTEGTASNNFFDRVNAKVGIVPGPKHLWCAERSVRIRDYFKSKKTKMYISGFHGDILIRHFRDKEYKISTEISPEEICGEKKSLFRRILEFTFTFD
ncbi:MAG: MBL fold metallo-hydrolase [Leptospiraceae bacterium]|nr:MBL fold metallo-hydrolase [Leptospiraceae bacterium]